MYTPFLKIFYSLTEIFTNRTKTKNGFFMFQILKNPYTVLLQKNMCCSMETENSIQTLVQREAK